MRQAARRLVRTVPGAELRQSVAQRNRTPGRHSMVYIDMYDAWLDLARHSRVLAAIDLVTKGLCIIRSRKVDPPVFRDRLP